MLAATKLVIGDNFIVCTITQCNCRSPQYKIHFFSRQLWSDSPELNPIDFRFRQLYSSVSRFVCQQHWRNQARTRRSRKAVTQHLSDMMQFLGVLIFPDSGEAFVTKCGKFVCTTYLWFAVLWV